MFLKYNSKRCIVLFQLDRYLAVFFPFRSSMSKIGKSLSLALFIFAPVFYSFSIFTARLEDSLVDESLHCVASIGYYEKFTSIMSIFEISSSIIIPFALIISINILFSKKLKNKSDKNMIVNQENQETNKANRKRESVIIRKAEKQDTLQIFQNYWLKSKSRSLSCLYELERGQLLKTKKPSIQFYSKEKNTYFSTKSDGRKKCVCASTVWRNSIQVKRQRSFFKANKIVILTFFLFLLLQSPMAAVKILTSIHWSNEEHVFNINDSMGTNFTERNSTTASEMKNFKNFSAEKSLLIHILERVAACLYYVNYVTNLFVYSLNTPKLIRTQMKSMAHTAANIMSKLENSLQYVIQQSNATL